MLCAGSTLLEYGRLHAAGPARPDVLDFVRTHLAGGDGSDYGSDTDAEPQPEPEPESAALDPEGRDTPIHPLCSSSQGTDISGNARPSNVNGDFS